MLENFNHTPQCVVLLVGISRSQYTLLSCVAMALNRYFQASEKSGCKLPDPGGPLSRLVPSSSIVSANKCRVCWKSRTALKSEWAKGTTLRQALSRTECRNRQAGSRARCYSQVIRNCWAMGSLVPRPFPPPVFDRLQYANTEGEGLGDLITCGYVR